MIFPSANCKAEAERKWEEIVSSPLVWDEDVSSFGKVELGSLGLASIALFLTIEYEAARAAPRQRTKDSPGHSKTTIMTQVDRFPHPACSMLENRTQIETTSGKRQS